MEIILIRKNELIRLEKHKWIAELVEGRSFIDVGGLWGTLNETVCLAVKSGARSATMADIQPFDSKWWVAFHERCKELGVEGYESIRMDICNRGDLDTNKQYDFVHCSGIIYHVSDPLQLIQNLKTICSEYLIITSMIIPEKITNRYGMIESPQGTCHLVNTLPKERREIFRQFLEEKKRNPDIVSQKTYEDLFRPDGTVRTGPWWWLFTSKTLDAMCELCGLEILRSHTVEGYSHTILCKPKG